MYFWSQYLFICLLLSSSNVIQLNVLIVLLFISIYLVDEICDLFPTHLFFLSVRHGSLIPFYKNLRLVKQVPILLILFFLSRPLSFLRSLPPGWSTSTQTKFLANKTNNLDTYMVMVSSVVTSLFESADNTPALSQSQPWFV